MALIEWNESYSVGIKKIDDQHKKLIDIINELNDAMSKGNGKAVLEGILSELTDYTVEHFATEEEYFDQYEYPQTEAHKAQHKKFCEDVVKYKEDYESGKILLSFKIINFLKDWLIKHILASDKEYSGFLTDKGLK